MAHVSPADNVADPANFQPANGPARPFQFLLPPHSSLYSLRHLCVRVLINTNVWWPPQLKLTNSYQPPPLSQSLTHLHVQRVTHSTHHPPRYPLPISVLNHWCNSNVTKNLFYFRPVSIYIYQGLSSLYGWILPLVKLSLPLSTVISCLYRYIIIGLVFFSFFFLFLFFFNTYLIFLSVVVIIIIAIKSSALCELICYHDSAKIAHLVEILVTVIELKGFKKLCSSCSTSVIIFKGR